eukprot:3860517-Rhodomonas_salina.1
MRVCTSGCCAMRVSGYVRCVSGDAMCGSHAARGAETCSPATSPFFQHVEISFRQQWHARGLRRYPIVLCMPYAVSGITIPSHASYYAHFVARRRQTDQTDRVVWRVCHAVSGCAASHRCCTASPRCDARHGRGERAARDGAWERQGVQHGGGRREYDCVAGPTPLSAYALPMLRPVLAKCRGLCDVRLRGQYAMSGTDIAYPGHRRG